MVTQNYLSVDDPGDGAPLLPVATETTTPTPVGHRQRDVLKTESRDFFLSRYNSSKAEDRLYSKLL